MGESIKIDTISALIVAYQRPQNVEKIILKLIDSGIVDIYVSLDYPSDPNLASLDRFEEIVSVVQRFAVNPKLKIKLATFSRNVGCGVAVTLACDWFFESTKLGIILEDDCIPTSGFVEYASYALAQVVNVSDLFVFSGSRLDKVASKELAWELNTFPVFWGWGTTAEKWKYLSAEMRKPLPILRNYPEPFSYKSTYWRAGSRRAKEGFVDAWDTVVSELFFRMDLKNLTPRQSFIQNVGDDAVATHKMIGLSGLQKPVENFDRPMHLPVFDLGRSEKCGKELYGYSFRHYLSTLITKVLDRSINSKTAREPLVERLKECNSYYSEMVLCE